MGYYYKIQIAGIEINYNFHFAETSGCFHDKMKEAAVENAISVKEYDFNVWETKWGYKACAPTEIAILPYRTSDYLLNFNRCVYHAVAFLYKNKSYLITAQSGTGKSTQLKNWMQLYGDETKIINGDKPVIEKTNENTILVHPSPWKGKEGWGDDSLPPAPLGGVIFLSQAKENKIERMTNLQAAIPLLSRFLFTVESEENVRQACAIESCILDTVPVFHLSNVGDLASTQLIHNVITEVE